MKREITGCGVCRDLMPLVQDGVASDESRMLVEAHLKECRECRELYKEYEVPELPTVDDRNVLRRIRRQLLFGGLLFLLAGSAGGVLLTASAGMFYNFAIMPVMGALAVITLGRRWFLVPAGITVLTLIWMALTETSVSVGLASGVWFGLIYFLLCLTGAVITVLFRYAFGKEEPHEENKDT